MTSDSLSIAGKTRCIFGEHYPASRGDGVASWVNVFMGKDGWFTTGLSEFTLIFVQLGPFVPAHLATGEVVRDGSDGQRARWDAYLSSLPRRRFGRKKRELVMTLRGDEGLDFVDRHYLTNVTIADIHIGTRMILRAVEKAQSTFKASDGVDLSPLIRSAEALLARNWPDDAAMRVELTAAYALDRARIDAMDPWAKLDLRGFHPKARSILDQPSDWSVIDDFSPHGNDLGADILANWTNLKKQSIARIAEYFELDLAVDDPEASMARIQISLALAFGHIKKSGTCPAALATQALENLQAHRKQAASLVRSDHLGHWEQSCDRHRAILASFLHP